MKYLQAILKNWKHTAFIILIFGIAFSGYSAGKDKNGFFCNKTKPEFPDLKDGKK